jgi:hypothetical protein
VRLARPTPRERRSFAVDEIRRAISGMPSAPFTWTKAGLELEIGFGDFEHLAAPFRPLGYVRDLSGRSDLPAGANVK